MHARVLVLAIAVSGSARADPASQRDGEPALELDPSFRTAIEGIGATETEVNRGLWKLGPHARASTETSVWSNHSDAVAHGWTLSARISRELGWGLTLTLDGGLARRLGGIAGDDGTVGTVGVALTRLFHWSHKRVAWISVTAELSRWFGASRPAVPVGKVVGVQIGTTF